MSTKEPRHQVLDGLLRCILDMPPVRGRRRASGLDVVRTADGWQAWVNIEGARFTCGATDQAMLYYSVALRLSRRWRLMRNALQRVCDRLQDTVDNTVEGRGASVQLYEANDGRLGARVLCGFGGVTTAFTAEGLDKYELSQLIMLEFDRL